MLYFGIGQRTVYGDDGAGEETVGLAPRSRDSVV